MAGVVLVSGLAGGRDGGIHPLAGIATGSAPRSPTRLPADPAPDLGRHPARRGPAGRGHRRRRARLAAARPRVRRPPAGHPVAVARLAAAAVADQPDRRLAADHLVAAPAARGRLLAAAAAAAGRLHAAGRWCARGAAERPAARGRRGGLRRGAGRHQAGTRSPPPGPFSCRTEPDSSQLRHLDATPRPGGAGWGARTSTEQVTHRLQGEPASDDRRAPPIAAVLPDLARMTAVRHVRCRYLSARRVADGGRVRSGQRSVQGCPSRLPRLPAGRQHLESDVGGQDGEEPESFAPQHEAPSGRPFRDRH